MATITQNNIDFTNVQASNIYAAGGKFSISMNDDGSLKRGDIVPLINAVEIDWNAAQVNGITLNTTGQLLKQLQ